MQSDVVAKTIYTSIGKNDSPEINTKNHTVMEYIDKQQLNEYRQNIPIKSKRNK